MWNLGKSVAQIALKWLLQQDMVSSVIIGAKKMEQLVDNMGAGDDSWTLSEEQVSHILMTSLSMLVLFDMCHYS